MIARIMGNDFSKLSITIFSCRFSRSNAQCTIQEECDRVSLTRTTSVRSTVEFPPNIDEKDLEILGEIGSGAYGRALKVSWAFEY